MYGGVSVQRLLPNLGTASGKTRKERRTLWLILPKVGSLRLGFVSKLSDGEGAESNKSNTQRVRRDTGDSSLLGLEGDLATVASDGEVRQVRKNMSNQAAVHKAFLLVLNELKTRYGSEGKGLVASFLSVVSSLPNPESAVAAVGKNGRKSSRCRDGRSTVSPFRRTTPSRTSSADSNTASKPKKTRPESGFVSFDDIMNASHDLPHPNEPLRRKEDRPARPAKKEQVVKESRRNLALFIESTMRLIQVST
jgi:hypothetical protein